MAVYYYDPTATGGTTSGTTTTGTGSSSNYTVVTITTCTSTSTGDDFYVSAPRSREIVVEHPADWTDEQHKAYVNLVNEEAKSSGWRVTMLFKGGDLALVDPNIEIRKMKDFVPLLRHRANTEDRARIDEFFKANPA